MDETHSVIAPEGLNRFYYDEEHKTVGASWMTREDRLDEISDYCNFLTTVEKTYFKDLNQDTKIILLGFSQGGATIMRWVNERRPLCHHIVLWAGDFPIDVDFATLKNYLTDKKLYYICGDKDPLLNAERLNRIEMHLKDNELKVEMIKFDGKHQILVPVLDKFIAEHVEL